MQILIANDSIMQTDYKMWKNEECFVMIPSSKLSKTPLKITF